MLQRPKEDTLEQADDHDCAKYTHVSFIHSSLLAYYQILLLHVLCILRFDLFRPNINSRPGPQSHVCTTVAWKYIVD